MEEIIKKIVQKFYHASKEEADELKQQLISLAEEQGKKSVVSVLESCKKKELLKVQWQIEDVLEILDPPKKVEEVIDDPSTRRLRMSEIELRYADPRGLRLYSSKVDDRWVIMRMDPQTGGMMQQEIDGEKASMLLQQLAGSPYWVNPPGQ